MNDINIVLSSNEQNTITEVLLDAKKDRFKNKKEFKDIDNVIDKVSGRITLFRRGQLHIKLHNGVEYEDIFKGGQFQSENGTYTIQDINSDNTHIKVNGNWHHKGEFEPAIVIQAKGKSKGISR